MSETIRSSQPKAQKDYSCQGKEQIDFTGGREIEEAEKQFKSCKGIKKGDIYEYQFNKDGSEVWSWRSCKRCFDVIIKHELHDF